MQKYNFKRSIFTLLLIITLLSLSSLFVFSLEFTTLPSMNNDTKSEDNLVCSWNSSIDTTTTNITWYNGSNIYGLTKTTTSYQEFLPLVQKKGEIWTCEIMITDGITILSANYSVNIKNSPPKNLFLYNLSNNFKFDNSTNLIEDIANSFYVNATDYDNDVLTYSIDDSLGSMSFNVLSGLFTWTPTQSNIGFNNVTFWVKDNTLPPIKIGLPFSFFVVQVNDAPNFTQSLSNKTANESKYFEYNLTGIDEEVNYPLKFYIINSSGLTLSIQNMSNTTAKIYFTPTFNDKGNHTIIIGVNDSLNASTISQFNLEVKAINHEPNLTYFENVSKNQGESFLLKMNATDFDENDTITFFISTPNCPYAVSSLWNITQLNNSANNSYAVINVTNLTNNHIICRNISIILFDGKQNKSYSKQLNITNINDAPIIYENSSYSTNTKGNTNIYNLTAYQYSKFRYKINFTDIDYLTYQSDSVNISIINFTAFNITLNKTTGDFNFSTNLTGNFEIVIQAKDSGGLTDNKTLNLTIIENVAPNISLVPNFTINESSYFTYKINATDIQNLTYYTNASDTLFVINNVTGNISFTPNQSQIGNYSILITVIDDYDAETSIIFKLSIINKNDAPVFNSTSDFNSKPIVVSNLFTYQLGATDKDLDLPSTPINYSYDHLTFFTNSTLSNFNLNKLTGLITFIPQVSDIGNHSILIGVNDSLGLNDTRIINITVFNVSIAPQIINITPYGPPPTKFGWNTTPINGYTNINISENMTVLFNHTTISDESLDLSYTWYFNNTIVSTDYSYEHNFTFFSSGFYNLTLVINDSHYSKTNFTWRLNVTDLNRPVVFFINPDNMSIDKTSQDSDYFKFKDVLGTFYDPDDDYDSNGIIDGIEKSTLTISYNYVFGLIDALTIEINGSKAVFTPLKTGEVLYNFTASDGKTNATTGSVYFNVTVDDTGKVQTPQTQSNTRTVTRNVFYQVEVDKIVTIDVLAPKSVVMYENNSVLIPVTLKNTGNLTLFGITMSAISENKEIEMTFDKSNIDQLFPNTEEKVNLYVKSFRSQGSYEIEVKAKVNNPGFEDTAVILVSSVEKDEGLTQSEETTKTMITFAKDLLSTNKKCLELNEVLNDVEKDLSQKNYASAQKKIDDIVKSCRYLSSSKEAFTESPKNVLSLNIKNLQNNQFLFYIISGIVIIACFGIIFSIYYTNKKD